MKWFRIPKELSKQPSTGKLYSDWKVDLSIECKEQCIYCCIHTSSFGGIRNFHVEHYRPKAENKFPHLQHIYSNLFFACSICNGFKHDDWPGEPSPGFDNYSYPDPSKVDYSDLLFQDSNYVIDSNYIAGKYIVQKLFLNRPQLILERKRYQLLETLESEAKKLLCIINDIKKKDDPTVLAFIEACTATTIGMIILIKEKHVNPYTQDQIKR